MQIDNDTRAFIMARLHMIRERMTAFAKKHGARERKVLKIVNEIWEVIR